MLVTRLNTTDPLIPGNISAPRAVPKQIERPEYLFHDGPEQVRGGDIKSAETIEKIRRAGTIAADALAAVGAAVRPGVTTDELDQIGHDFLIEAGAYPSCLNYMGFPKSLCTSLNEVICHGIPDDQPLLAGDILNIDITAYVDGVHGDTCAMFFVGGQDAVDEASRNLVTHTREALRRGIKAVKPGREINVIGRVIERYAARFGYGVVRDFTGHGVGEAFHSGLIIPHYDAPEADTVMEVGMVFTIEPMLTLGSYQWSEWNDGWTIVTEDGSRSAQFEHTIVVTEDGADILTLPTGMQEWA